MFALGRRQIALLAKPSLQLVRLRLGEQHATFLLPGRRNVGRQCSADDRRIGLDAERVRRDGGHLGAGVEAPGLSVVDVIVVGGRSVLVLDGQVLGDGGQLRLV